MSISKFKYRLGGATYDVIKHCSPDTKIKYSNLAYSLLLSTILAAIGGYDIAHQFTTLMAFCIAVGILWGIAVFSFDYFLINSSATNSIFKFIRIPVGLANVFITITALFVLLNQSTIDTTINLTNADKVKRCDSSYLHSKENRYVVVKEEKKNIDEYHQKNCVPEALNGHPGHKYDLKHSLCISTNNDITQETAKLDTAEKSYITAYQTEKGALQGIASNDFFAKAKLLPDILKANWLILVLAVCLFIFLGYIELQSILMKFAIDPNDEYHNYLRKYLGENRGVIASKMDNDRSAEKDKVLIDQFINDEASKKRKFDVYLNAIDALAVRELEVKGKIDILQEYGYTVTAENLKELWDKHIKVGFTSPGGTSDIFKMTQSMTHQVEEIKRGSTNDNQAQNIFNWLLTNIVYDKGHSKEHYRNARETYNEKRGLCGELSVLYISFLRALQYDCNFCEVTKDNSGKDVSHACIIIKNNNGVDHLSDLAYQSFIIEHLDYKEITDVELKAKYDNWNQ